MEEKQLTIKEVIYRDMDTMIMSKLKNDGKISVDDLIDIASYLAASLFRSRWQQKGELTEDEIQIVLGNIGDFCHEHFDDNFTQNDYDKVVKISQLLLQKPTFDDDSKTFFDNITKANK